MSRSKQRRYDWLTFTSDYGLDDVFVGVCKGVVAQIAPHLQIIDVCHQITAQDVEQGATTLATAIGYLPVAVHLALVDPIQSNPSHNGAARGIVVETADGSMLLGPDNGLLSRAWDERGGVVQAAEITNPALWRETVHKTFRGRDVFAPVAAHLANGIDLGEVGSLIDTDTIIRLPSRDVEVDDDHVHAEVSLVDHFGNVSLNLTRSDLEAAGIIFGDTVELRCNGRTMALPFTATYGEVPRGRLTLCEDSFRAVMLAVNSGHASRELRVGRGDPVVIARIPQSAGAARAIR
jgi:S-adenosyl-L-methionine hydrolase (adenosine-forming)